MDSHSYSRLLSYAVCEMTMPIKKHVYNFAASDQTSMKPQLLSVAALAAQSQSQKNILNKEMSAEDMESKGSGELCEGTETAKSAFGDVLNQPRPSCNKLGQKRPSSKEDDWYPVSKKLKTQITGSKGEKDPMLKCSESDFKGMFRVSRSTFEILVEILSEEELEPIENVPLYKKVLIVLWLLGTTGSHKEAAEKFDVSEEAVTSCLYDICATLYNKFDTFIKWPSFDEADEIASRIEDKYGFPGVVGVLGCKYFTITIPKEPLTRREHFNGKLRMYCVALQIVCDDEFIIRDIFAGLPGGIPPTQVLRESPLEEHLTSKESKLVDPNKHVLARAEFPQLTSMLTPITKKSEALTKDEKDFNTMHESVCSLVDQTCKMLKGRFPILKFLHPESATMVLTTACVLHNICIQNGDNYNPEDLA